MNRMVMGIAIDMALGAAIGVAMGNVAVGAAMEQQEKNRKP